MVWKTDESNWKSVQVPDKCLIIEFQVNGPEAPIQNGLDKGVVGIAQGVGELTFEEEEEEQFMMKDLPKHACS